MTGDVEPESVGWWFTDKVNSEAVLGDERLQHVAHHIDLQVPTALRLTPQHWVVEQIERRSFKLTIELY